MQQIKSLLQKEKEQINNTINRHISFYKKNWGHVGTTTHEAFDRLESFATGGKGIRGGLFILSANMFQYKQKDILLDIAASLELLQASLLIHDDIMDNDFIRRGNPSVFAQYKEVGGEIYAANTIDYGKSMAICIGDIGFFIAMDIATQTLHTHKNRELLLQLLHKELIIVGFAQMDDVTFAASNTMPSIDDIIRMYLYKTAHYTFSLPLSLAALIADTSQEVVSQMEILGEHIGLLFQIKDDELSMYGNEKMTGKPIGSDLREDKKTLSRALLYKKISDQEKQKLETLSQKNITEENIAYYRSLLEKYQIKNELHTIINAHKEQAEQIITTLPVSEDHKKVLYTVVTYVDQRSK